MKNRFHSAGVVSPSFSSLFLQFQLKMFSVINSNDLRNSNDFRNTNDVRNTSDVRKKYVFRISCACPCSGGIPTEQIL